MEFTIIKGKREKQMKLKEFLKKMERFLIKIKKFRNISEIILQNGKKTV
jgi:hypothetical protein